MADTQERIGISSHWNKQDITLVSTLAISPVTLGDSGVYTCQSGVDSGAVANVTVIVTSGEQHAAILEENSAIPLRHQGMSYQLLPAAAFLVYSLISRIVML